ncbi:ubiquitin-conjugating enzyme E2 Z-like [Hydractinia symbiolongicarpus]|uniref:ubiquitin-conjugating enzyme E2 Z-like n=1 Tax=Hydractinia symbiolongicarpus TaxID=13093 RepID=UPI002550B2E2|nr:ubiquitin-conjugating enzyme E2 Z-like [Hydractinia symbiolongicarpus]XP_057317563.1 ubiquitin-conjugating enzyme E2 Z-like [Hydractinia symbiolongicarpus]
MSTKEKWDPLLSHDWDGQEYSALSINRVKRDLTDIYADPLPFVFVCPDQNNISKIHAIISGPQDTPYEGGFFYFVIRMSPEYPVTPPRVKLITTGGGTVRFNPNLYDSGMVCLSILGTWSGPGWSAANSLKSLLLSIQSIMNKNPYHNEPGFTEERHPGDAKNYKMCIHHETLRVAVVGMVDGSTTMPAQLKEIVERTFLEYLEYYEETIGNYIHLDGEMLRDPFGKNKGRFQYAFLLTRINALATELRKKYAGLGKIDKTGVNIDFS